MSPFNFNQDPVNIARTFSQYVKAMVWILLWILIALASLGGAYLAVRGLWLAVNLVLKSMGV